MHWQDLADHAGLIVEELRGGGVSTATLSRALLDHAAGREQHGVPEEQQGLVRRLAFYLFGAAAREGVGFQAAATVGLGTAAATGDDAGLDEVLALARATLEEAWTAREAWPEAQLADFYFERGTEAGEAGQPLLAVMDLEAAVDADPADPKIRLNLGSCYHSLQAWQDAYAQYTDALELDPEYHLARLKRGTLMYMLGHDEDAIADLGKGLEGLPADDPSREHAENLLRELGAL